MESVSLLVESNVVWKMEARDSIWELLVLLGISTTTMVIVVSVGVAVGLSLI